MRCLAGGRSGVQRLPGRARRLSPADRPGLRHAAPPTRAPRRRRHRRGPGHARPPGPLRRPQPATARPGTERPPTRAPSGLRATRRPRRRPRARHEDVRAHASGRGQRHRARPPVRHRSVDGRHPPAAALHPQRRGSAVRRWRDPCLHRRLRRRSRCRRAGQRQRPTDCRRDLRRRGERPGRRRCTRHRARSRATGRCRRHRPAGAHASVAGHGSGVVPRRGTRRLRGPDRRRAAPG